MKWNSPCLNLPEYELKTSIRNDRVFVFDRLRKKFVRLTPEERVRQYFIHYLINEKGFPEALMANEITIQLGNVKKRCDSIVYNQILNPLMIIEYKSPEVRITQKSFDQIARYNMELKVPWLIVSNGISHFCCYLDKKGESFRFLETIPDYRELFLSK